MSPQQVPKRPPKADASAADAKPADASAAELEAALQRARAGIDAAVAAVRSYPLRMDEEPAFEFRP